MTDKLHIGVIGLGWAGVANMKAFIEQPDTEVVGVADTDAEHMEKIQKQYQIVNGYEDYHDLIARDDIDAVIIGSPNFLHAPIAIAAMESGKHVLTEKPLAHTLKDAEQMVAASKQHNRVLKMVTNQRRADDVLTFKRYIDEGMLGRIYHAKAHWMRRKGIPGAGRWFTRKERSGGGPLIDLGVHVLDMALFLMDEPTPISVSAATYAEHGRLGKGYRVPQEPGAYNDVEDFSTAFIRMEDGMTLTLDVSWEVYSRHQDDFGVALYGTSGGGEIQIEGHNRNNTLSLFTDTAGTPATIQPRVNGVSGHVDVAREFIDVIFSEDWNGHHGEDALKRTRIIDACYQSAAQGREIALVTP